MMLTAAVTEPNRLKIVEVPEPMPEDYEARSKTEVVAPSANAPFRDT
jgi:hypothetical protein